MKRQLIIVTIWFKKFRSICKDLEYKARSVRPKNVDSETVFQTLAENQESRIQRVSGELGISQPTVVRHLHGFDKKHRELLNYASRYQNIAKLLTHSSI